MFVTGSVHLETFHLTAYFCKTVYSLSVFMCYCEIIRVLFKIILDWLMHFNIIIDSPHTENYVIAKWMRLVLHYFSQACTCCSSKASLVLMSYKTVLKEDTRQCLLDLMWDAIQWLKATQFTYFTQTLNCLGTGHYLCRGVAKAILN